MNNNIFQVIKSSSPLYLIPRRNSQLISECLFGEHLKVLKKNKNWYYIQLLTDKYKGWIELSNLSLPQNNNYRVIANRTNIYTKPNIKSNISFYLSLGSMLNVTLIDDLWATVSYQIKKKNFIGFVPTNDIVKKKGKVSDWVKIAENLIHTPYKWGGRDTLGLDCSALVQLSLQTYGLEFPRDTNLQTKINFLKIKDRQFLKRGMLVFWEGHVAILLDKENIIHANAFHMKTEIEPLIEAEKRIEKQYGEIKLFLNIPSNT
ncbi:NlpC/P60 family protein [Alphaproteobacteria bacterium]|nr:C40 family peptidase [Alphaproteobacteria bacterium]MDC1023111.1 NlpC/P60 family protein [Alphaproteobacteria bacterium]